MRNSHAEARRWLEQARYDLRTANWNVQGEFHAPACFWAQQAAEKSARAYLYFRGERFVLGHSVAELLEKCKTHEPDFESLTFSGTLLDRFYIPTRYPNATPGGIPALAYNEKDSGEAIELATKIFEFVLERIKEY